MEPVKRSFPEQSEASESQSTVIIGAGIMGCASAYYLSRSGHTRPDSIHLVEISPELFASASGKSGGFIAADWFAPSTATLGALSFELHKQLAQENHGGKEWGYSRSTGTSMIENSKKGGVRGYDWIRHGGSRAEAAGVHEFNGDQTGPAWLTTKSGDRIEVLSEGETAGQVDPLRLSRFLLRESVARGVRLHQPARALSCSRDGKGVLSALQILPDSGAELRIPCTRILITAGAWTRQVFETLFPHATAEIPIEHLAGHSLVVRSPRWTKEHETQGCHAVFTTMRDGFSPEIFSRMGEELYVAGLNSSTIPLPARAVDAQVDDASISELQTVAQKLLGQTGTDVSDLEILREGLCFRPTTDRGTPILDRISDAELGGVNTKAGRDGGVFVAAGHGPWGISHSLGTGKVMAEMLEGQALSADVSALGLYGARHRP
nr:putative oxidoreductase c1f5.03c [Quercus suber]